MVAPSRVPRGRPTGLAHHKARLTPELVRSMRAAYADGCSLKSLARSFNVNRTTVEKVVRRETWRDVT